MRILIGDDVGQAKVIETSRGIDTANQQSARATITSFFPPSSTRPIQHAICVSYQGRNNLAAVFSKGGFLRIFDPSSSPISPQILLSHTLSVPVDTNTVALGLCENILYAATATGKTLLVDLNTSSTSTIDLSGPISAFTTSSACGPSGLPAAVAIGGENRDLEIFTLSSSNDNFGVTCTSLWKAKNVKPTSLKLEVSIHPTQIVFLPANEGSYRFVVASKYGHLRVYDTAVSRRPVFSAEPSKAAICRLQIHPDCTIPPSDRPLVATPGQEADKAKIAVDFRVIYTNSAGIFAIYNFHERREVGQFKGFTGAVLGLDVDNQHGLVAGVGFGRYLAVYSARDLMLKTRVYVKTQGCSVVILDGADQVVEVEKNRNKEEDEVWGGLQEVDSDCSEEDGDAFKLVRVKVKRKRARKSGDVTKRPRIG